MATENTRLASQGSASFTQYPSLQREQRQEAGSKSLSCNVGYLQTRAAMLRLCQLSLAVLCTSTSTPTYAPQGSSFFLIMVYNVIINSVFWILVRLSNLNMACSQCGYLELIHTVVVTGFAFVGMCVQFAIWSPISVNIPPGVREHNLTGAVFGIFTTLLCGALCYVLFNEWKSSLRQSYDQLSS